MKTEFEQLKELEQTRKITVGVHRNHANNFWYRQTTIGKILNWLTPILVIFSIVAFIKFGFFEGILVLISTGIYAVLIQKIASMHVRILLLQNEELFDVAYEARSITIKNNSTGKIMYYPIDWKKEVVSI